MGRPEVNVQCLPELLSALFLETSSLTEPGAHRLVRLGCP